VQSYFSATMFQQLVTAYSPNADALMYATESLKNHKPGILNKLIQNSNKKKVIVQNHVALMKLLSSSIKVKIDIEMLNEFSNGIPVSVGFLQTQTSMKNPLFKLKFWCI
jgi:hypothetical protein